jgi:hypothetical protein
MTRNHQFHAQTKHIDVHFHFICWIIENGSLCLVYCPTNDMVADALTTRGAQDVKNYMGYVDFFKQKPLTPPLRGSSILYIVILHNICQRPLAKLVVADLTIPATQPTP